MRSLVALWIVLGLLLAGTAPAVAADRLPRLDPQQDYQAERSQTVNYKVDFSVIVTAPYKTKVLEVWLPIPPSNAGQDVLESRLSSFPQRIEPQLAKEPVFGNRFAYFRFEHPHGAQIIRHRFTVAVHELNWRIDPAKVARIAQWPASFAPYRQSDSQAVVINEGIASLAREIVPAADHPLADLSRVMRYAQTNFTYDHDAASLQASALHAFTTRRGHCSDYHGFCAAVGRALGYPTRVTYGINPFPKNSPSHCKLEAYLPPYGWVSFDVSETQKLLAQIEKDSALDASERARRTAAALARMTAGFRDNTWYLQTVGTDYELVPKASKRVAVVRTAYIEADGRPLAEPDPASHEQQAFTWMTAQDYLPDQAIAYPFSDLKTLDAWLPKATGK